MLLHNLKEAQPMTVLLFISDEGYMQWSLNLLQINKLHTTCMIKLIKDFNQIVFILEAYSKLRKISLNKKKEYIFFFCTDSVNFGVIT